MNKSINNRSFFRNRFFIASKSWLKLADFRLFSLTRFEKTVVNDKNKKFLYKLVLNGPDEYPGAKIYEKKNGDSISLRYVDRSSIVLENGDIVHRHMMDGDAVLFNRQPSLHRMSMMCHIAKIMKKGDTFRMNVADTKPYNADRLVVCLTCSQYIIFA